jgi:TonB-linked SusC/RagA family outer membrane protein
LGYSFKEKYLLEFDAREDGSDLFPPGHRYGFFPAVSAGWRLSEEKFIKDNLTFINNLKIRASWGEAGNDRAGAFQYLNNYSIPTYIGYGFGGANAVAGQILLPDVIANPIFTWEKATTTDIGLDANFWHNLLGISADIFHKRTSNILGSNASAIPAIIGGQIPIGNYGIVDNDGIEVQLSHQNKIGQVSYFIRPNITYNKSKVISYPDAAGTPDALRLTGKQVQPGTLITGYVANGLYQNQAEITSGPTPLYAATQPGDIKYADVDGDGQITASDKVIISNGLVPTTLFGLNLGAGYKGFDVSIFFQGATGIKDVIPSQLFSSNYAGLPIDFPIARNYWTPTNTGATFPRLTVTSRNNNDLSTYWVRNGSYLRLKNFEIAYTLPKNWLSKLSVTNTRIFVSGTNLFTLSHLKGIMDPETQVFNYPLVKVFNAGVSVKF